MILAVHIPKHLLLLLLKKKIVNQFFQLSFVVLFFYNKNEFPHNILDVSLQVLWCIYCMSAPQSPFPTEIPELLTHV